MEELKMQPFKSFKFYLFTFLGLVLATAGAMAMRGAFDSIAATLEAHGYESVSYFYAVLAMCALALPVLLQIFLAVAVYFWLSKGQKDVALRFQNFKSVLSLELFTVLIILLFELILFLWYQELTESALAGYLYLVLLAGVFAAILYFAVLFVIKLVFQKKLKKHHR